jgi:oligogalacturonide transporter
MSNKAKKITVARGVGYGLVDLMGGCFYHYWSLFTIFLYNICGVNAS